MAAFLFRPRAVFWGGIVILNSFAATNFKLKRLKASVSIIKFANLQFPLIVHLIRKRKQLREYVDEMYLCFNMMGRIQPHVNMRD